MRKSVLANVDSIFSRIAETTPLFLPVDDPTGRANYTRWEEGKHWSDALNTVKSPKDFFFPQVEDLVKFKVQGKKIELANTARIDEDFVVFGVRPCDVKSFSVLDNVFINEPKDGYYAARREHGIIISVACSRPSETCFCGTFGVSPSEECGDITVWKGSEELYWKANTERGEALLATLDALTEECPDDAADPIKEKINKIAERLPLKDVSTEKFGGDKTETYFNDPAWKSLSESCLGCGTCTFVCPTCQCYDIKDFNTGNGIIRFRCWDSCMYSEFTKMSAGQPRLTQLERFRQRFMHKLVYYPANYDGMFSCVGCGRCLKSCPISMNIVKVMKTLGGGADE